MSGYADDTVEGFGLAVRRTGPAASVCADAAALAKKVWPKLPKL
ncbi:hypothetical protein [Labedaea rhizosphaerae]|uniref:Uncharacterized protein n=1 Tax=Labedaea rhizosphaerae TaxID=598644 RepID=A0A4R6SC96_LABRH|nr:hypothetical protein [Labedaea rhizosphaerae]TDP97581.1 hypothetical protein EV186_103545 [Labedaea rhizosphaerae]